MSDTKKPIGAAPSSMINPAIHQESGKKPFRAGLLFNENWKIIRLLFAFNVHVYWWYLLCVQVCIFMHGYQAILRPGAGSEKIVAICAIWKLFGDNLS